MINGTKGDVESLVPHELGIRDPDTMRALPNFQVAGIIRCEGIERPSGSTRGTKIANVRLFPLAPGRHHCVPIILD
jgi:hypothetical protein